MKVSPKAYTLPLPNLPWFGRPGIYLGKYRRKEERSPLGRVVLAPVQPGISLVHEPAIGRFMTNLFRLLEPGKNRE